MSSEQAAYQASQNRHNRYMGFGKKQRYIEVFQCSGEDMNLVLTGTNSTNNLANLAVAAVAAGGASGLAQQSQQSTGKAMIPPGMLPTLPPNNAAGLLSIPDANSLLAAAQLNPFALPALPYGAGVPPLVSPYPATDPKTKPELSLLGQTPFLIPGMLPQAYPTPQNLLLSPATAPPLIKLPGNPLATNQDLLQSQLAAQRLLMAQGNPVSTPSAATSLAQQAAAYANAVLPGNSSKRSFDQAFQSQTSSPTQAKRSTYVYGPSAVPTISAGPTTYSNPSPGSGGTQ